MKLEVAHLSGAGNDFAFINALGFKERPTKAQLSCWSKEICKDLGVDGAVFIQANSKIDVHWDFYNADGSSAEMCGNAARCAGLYCDKLKLAALPFQLHTLSGPVQVEKLQDGQYQVTMPQIKDENPHLKIQVNDSTLSCAFVNTGVPHTIICYEDANEVALKSLSATIREHERFQPAGTNVTFYKVIDPGHIVSSTYERGVEGFTQACGTGAVAAAWAHSSNTGGLERVRLELPGGQVEVDTTEARPLLIGPAKWVKDLLITL